MSEKEIIHKSIQLLILQQDSHCPVSDTISHLDLAGLNFLRKIWKYHWMIFSVDTAIIYFQQRETDQWRSKNRAFTIAYICCLFIQIQTFLCPIPYITWTWSDWTFQGGSENPIELYFLWIPPLLIGNNKRPFRGVQKRDHSQDHLSTASSAVFALCRSGYHISPEPGRVELSKPYLTISLEVLLYQYHYYSSVMTRYWSVAADK